MSVANWATNHEFYVLQIEPKLCCKLSLLPFDTMLAVQTVWQSLLKLAGFHIWWNGGNNARMGAGPWWTSRPALRLRFECVRCGVLVVHSCHSFLLNTSYFPLNGLQSLPSLRIPSLCGGQLTFVPGSSLRCLQPSWPAGCGTSLDMWDFRRRLPLPSGVLVSSFVLLASHETYEQKSRVGGAVTAGYATCKRSGWLGRNGFVCTKPLHHLPVQSADVRC